MSDGGPAGPGPVDPFSTGGEELAALLDLGPGWRPLYLAPLPDETWDDLCLLGIEGFVHHVLGPHPHVFHRCGQLAVVAIGPPDAEAEHRRLVDAFEEFMDAMEDTLN